MALRSSYFLVGAVCFQYGQSYRPVVAPNHKVPMTIKATYEDLVSVIRWIDRHSKEIDIQGDVRNLTAAALFDIVLEHQASIALLVEGKLNGSALALMRVMAETLVRGMWISRCATEDEVTRFQNDEIKKLTTLVQEIETVLGNATDTLSKLVRDQWGSLSSFTHSGIKQVTRRYSGPLLTPKYPDAEIIQALRFAGGIGLLAAIELAMLSKNEPLARATLERAKQFAA